MESMPPGIEPESIVPGSLREKQAERRLLQRTIYEITPTEEKSSCSSTTIHVHHRPVAFSQGIRHHRNRAASLLRRSGNSHSRLEGHNNRPPAPLITGLTVTATRLQSVAKIARTSILILQVHQIRLQADAEGLIRRRSSRLRLFEQNAQHPRVQFHFTPTYSSWLNQVEIWFAKIEREVIARGIFTSVSDLARKLRRYINAYSANARPIQWQYSDPTRRLRTNELTATPH